MKLEPRLATALLVFLVAPLQAQTFSGPPALTLETLERHAQLLPAPNAGEGGGGGASEAEEAGSNEALAKAAQNPVANLISEPFQNNFNFGSSDFNSRSSCQSRS